VNPHTYEFIEHTADIGIRVRAPDASELFVRAGLAMFDVIAREVRSTKSPVKKFLIRLGAENLEELFVAWLNELLSLSQSEGMIVTAIGMEELDERSLRATANGESADDYEMKTEIKAATYHRLSVSRSGRGWKAEVIFDV
jgi:SHS2 domain-containing protein